MESNLLEDSRIHQALEEFSGTLSSVDEIETEPFDGVFEVEGMEQPLVVPPDCTVDELAKLAHEAADNSESATASRLWARTVSGIPATASTSKPPILIWAGTAFRKMLGNNRKKS